MGMHSANFTKSNFYFDKKRIPKFGSIGKGIYRHSSKVNFQVRVLVGLQNYLREVQDYSTVRHPSMYNPLWWPARPLTPRVKGREGLGSFKIVRWWNW
jgi:hypothetical protein